MYMTEEKKKFGNIPGLNTWNQQKKVNMEPWNFNRLRSTSHITTDAKTAYGNLSQITTNATDEYEQASESNSETSEYCISIAPSRSSIIDLCKQIMTLTPIPTLIQQLFLAEEEAFTIVKSYLPDNDLNAN